MTERLARLEDAVAGLAATVGQLEARIATVEASLRTNRVLPAAAAEPAASSDQAAAPSADGVGESFNTATMTGIVTLVGRSFLVLAGAFLLRAVTEAGTLPAEVGVALGLGYAAVWIAAAAAAARRLRPASATFHGVCAAIVAYPLIWEAMRSFQVLSPNASVLLVAGVTGVGLTMAWRRAMRPVAWVFTVSAVLITVGLIAVSSATVPATGLLVVVGVASLWVSRSRDWPVLPWLPAIVTDLAVERAVVAASSPWAGSRSGGGAEALPGLLLAIGLVVGYLGFVAVQVLWRRRSVVVFDVFQTIAVLAVGVGGAVRIAGEGGAEWVGLAALAVGALCYWAAFTIVERTFGRGRDLVFVSTLGLLLILIGMPVVFGEVTASYLWAIFAIVAALLGGRFDRITLRGHAAVLAAAAAVAGGLIDFEIDALFRGSVSGAWRQPTVGVHLVLTAVVVTILAAAWSLRDRSLRWPYRLPLLAVTVVAAAGLCAEVVTLLDAPWFLDTQTAAGLAMVRTGVMAAGSLVLALLSVRFELPELGWLVYPTLVILGLKIVLQDLPAGGPLSIAVAFVCYGAALIAGPRLLRSGARTKAASG